MHGYCSIVAWSILWVLYKYSPFITNFIKELVLNKQTVGDKHAFLVIAHKDDETLRTLLRTLDDPRNDIFIHMDAKNKRWDEENTLASVSEAGIFSIPRISVTWGGYSLIACELGLLSAAVAKGHYSYYHLLSGQDLPIKSQDKIHSFFDSCGGKEFVRFENHNRDYRRRIGVSVIWNTFGKSKSQVLLRKANGYLSRILQCFRKPAKDLELMKGDQWFSITDGLARFLVENALQIRSIFWDSMCGDELFLQTFAWNADKRFDFYRMPGEDNADGIMRLIDWGEDESPRIFSINDLDSIKNSRMMFARKFDFGFDSDIVRAIEKLVS